MIFVPKFDPSGCLRKKMCRGVLLTLLAVSAIPSTGSALPARLVLALDGIAYRDLKALQAGITSTNFWGKQIHRRAFTAEEGYFPVSRMISTFPSASDVAWTDIFGDRPLPGYQRTYFSTAANSEISINGVTTSMEHERQMDWQVRNGVMRAMGYVYPLHTYEYELHGLSKNFWNTTSKEASYYVYIRASDDAQHLDRDVFAMLGMLDKQLQDLRARYQAREGRDLQIVILSDHGHNHAGRGRRDCVRDPRESQFADRVPPWLGNGRANPEVVYRACRAWRRRRGPDAGHRPTHEYRHSSWPPCSWCSKSFWTIRAVHIRMCAQKNVSGCPPDLAGGFGHSFNR